MTTYQLKLDKNVLAFLIIFVNAALTLAVTLLGLYVKDPVLEQALVAFVQVVANALIILLASEEATAPTLAK